MRQLVLTALMLLLATGAASAHSIDWESWGWGERDSSNRGDHGYDWERPNDGENGNHEYGDHEDGTEEECPEGYDGKNNGWGMGGYGTMGRGRHGGWGMGGYGWGRFYGWDPKQRVEDKFAELMESYDMGVAEIEGFFNSDEYAEIVEDLERLIDKHGGYVERKEDKVDWLGEWIDRLEGKLISYQEKWEEKDGDEMPEWQRDWMGTWHEKKEEWIEEIIESLSEKQADLEGKLDMHLALGDELSTYLDEIIDAGGMVPTIVDELSAADVLTTIGSDSIALSALALSPLAKTIESPEPTSAGLAAIGVVGFVVLGRRGRRRV